MPSQSCTCRYVHGVGVTHRICEMEKVKPEPPYHHHRPPLSTAVSHSPPETKR
ncbi:hypothetical protein DY000_02021882 [Brassica cretica]|uniref:Uncharacterized protein n=1 Tax=Brassica cretica TaxID=69181 RepID=A0ABQ7EAH5_BRACR|nr:hypothetical protein DY000_02021882 [Brassica cretica]